MEKQSVKLIQSVQRSIDILDCFTDASPRLSINEISQRVDLNINTTRGLVNTLTANGLLIHDKTNNIYRLGFYFMGKANVVQKQVESYITMSKGLVDAIANKYHISASLQMVNQNQIYSIYCAYPINTAYYIILSEYSILPKYATSSGKLLMLYNIYDDNDENALKNLEFKQFTPRTIMDAETLKTNLEEVRRNKYACELEEFALGVGSMAVPIFDLSNQLIATVSATFFVHSLPAIKDNLLADLKNIAATVSDNFCNIQKTNA